MRLSAYILAADPAWIEASVLSYYDIVEEIVVSYDETKRGWTGAPIQVHDCLRRLNAIDRNGKMRFCPGHYARLEYSPMQNDTYQRQCALDEVGRDAEWVLQLDTDEVLPNQQALLSILNLAEERDIPAVEWPMRVLFQKMNDGRLLQVCAADRQDRFEYPGPIAVRPGSTLVDARRTAGRFLRPIVLGDNHSLQILHPIECNEVRIELKSGIDAILHNSWARSPSSIRSKIGSWGHNEGMKSWLYYYLRWKPAPYLWCFMRDFHPFARGLWPALKPFDQLPASIPAEFIEGVA